MDFTLVLVFILYFASKTTGSIENPPLEVDELKPEGRSIDLCNGIQCKNPPQDEQCGKVSHNRGGVESCCPDWECKRKDGSVAKYSGISGSGSSGSTKTFKTPNGEGYETVKSSSSFSSSSSNDNSPNTAKQHFNQAMNFHHPPNFPNFPNFPSPPNFPQPHNFPNFHPPNNFPQFPNFPKPPNFPPPNFPQYPNFPPQNSGQQGGNSQNYGNNGRSVQNHVSPKTSSESGSAEKLQSSKTKHQLKGHHRHHPKHIH